MKKASILIKDRSRKGQVIHKSGTQTGCRNYATILSLSSNPACKSKQLDLPCAHQIPKTTGPEKGLGPVFRSLLEGEEPCPMNSYTLHIPSGAFVTQTAKSLKCMWWSFNWGGSPHNSSFHISAMISITPKFGDYNHTLVKAGEP